MNPVAQRALDRARESVPPAPIVPDLIITGPINRVMELEGKRYALDVVRAAGSSIRKPEAAAKIVRDLTITAAAQPSSYASGIKQIIDLLKVTP